MFRRIGLLVAVVMLTSYAVPVEAATGNSQSQIEKLVSKFAQNAGARVPLIVNESGAAWFRAHTHNRPKRITNLSFFKVWAYESEVNAALAALPDGAVLPNAQHARPQSVAMTAAPMTVPDPSYQANPLTITHANTVQAGGNKGSGQTVAIVDTGIQASHPYFKDNAGNTRIVGQACFVTSPGTAEFPCLNGEASDTSTNAADVGGQSDYILTNYDHGTHVAGIAAGNKSTPTSPPSYVPGGMAPEANIVAVRVFGQVDGAYDSDILAGLSWVSDHAAALNISSVNLSLGSTAVIGSCYAEFDYAPIFTTLRSRGVAPLVASGNDGNPRAVSSPGCVSSAIAVASSDRFDSVSPFSNVSPALDLIAPGQYIISSVPTDDYVLMSGTSMATPVVAGAFALVKASTPGISIDDWLMLMQNTGFLIDDTITKNIPRIDVAATIAAVSTLSAPGAPSNIDATWPNFNEYTLTWQAPLHGLPADGYRVSVGSENYDVSASTFEMTLPLVTPNLTVSVSSLLGGNVGATATTVVAPINNSLSAVKTSISTTVTVENLGGDYCSTPATPTYQIGYSSPTSAMRSLVLLTGDGRALRVTETSYSPPVGSGLTGSNLRKIVVSDPTVWITPDSALYATNASLQLSRAFSLAAAYSEISVAQVSPQTPGTFVATGSRERAELSWTAGDATSWRVFVDSVVQTVVTTNSVSLPLSVGSHDVAVCAVGPLVGAVQYTSVRVSSTVVAVAKLPQSITFSSAAAMVLGGATQTVHATATSGLAATYSSSTSAVCTVNALGVVTAKGAGTCTITAAQSGDQDYSSATSTSIHFSVTRPRALPVRTVKISVVSGKVTLTWAAPTNFTFAKVTKYQIVWRVALPKKAFGKWTTVNITSRKWVSTTYAKGTKLAYKIVAVGSLGASSIVTGTRTI